MQVKEFYGSLDMIIFRLSCCDQECTKYTSAYNVNVCEGESLYIEIDHLIIVMYTLILRLSKEQSCMHSKTFESKKLCLNTTS